MHPASAFRETDPQRLQALFDDRGLALLVGVTQSRPRVAHAPVLLRGARLRFHLSATNALTSLLRDGGVALAVVTGADAYVSPDWYDAAEQVPTWNYVSAEAEGPVRAMDREETIVLLDDLSASFEASLTPKPPWTRSKLSTEAFERLLAGIVGFEMRVDRLEGVRKLSQNKAPALVARLADQLDKRARLGSREIAAMMRR